MTLGVTLLSDLHSDLPVTLYKNIATPGGVDTQIGSHQGSEGKEEGDIREENGFFTVSDSPSNTEPVDSVKAECYRFARQLFNKRGASIVARAIADGKTPEEVMESLVDFAESGGDVDDFAASLFPTAWR